MSVSISIPRLCWSVPDGTPLFSDLTLAFGPERTGLVGRNGSGKSTLLGLIAGQLSPMSGSVQVSGSIAVMRQDAMAHPDDTIADLFDARAALELLDRAMDGRVDSEGLGAVDWTLPDRIAAALGRYGLSADPRTPLTRLSGGQRTRAALAAIVHAAPDFLLMDEPTNNLDRDGRRTVTAFLRGWRAGAIVASHDRVLLDEMDGIVELSTLGASRYGGNYTAFRKQKAVELDAAQHALADAAKAQAETARRAQEAAQRKARKDGAGHRARARGGQSKIQLDFAKARSEASGGAGLRLREARREAAEAALSAARERVEILNPITMDLAPSNLPAGRMVLRLDRVTAGHDRARPVIRDLSLTLTGPERVHLAGPNGSGKSTLLKVIAGQIEPFEGEVAPSVPVAMLDQHLGLLDPALTLIDNILCRNPAMTAHSAHAVLARFGFRAKEALCRAGSLSGGERLRAGLACTLGGTPAPMLLLLDEPTNHLDLEGIAVLEAALSAWDGAMVIVSHDEGFVASFAPERSINLRG